MTLTKIPISASIVDAKRVLIVEDDDQVAAMHSLVLKNVGWEAFHVRDTSAAVDALLRNRFAAVVTDLNMPKGSGIDLLRNIRTYDLDVPVILVTGQPTVETAIEAVELGALQYLEKPVAPQALIAAVERAWKLSRLAKAKREALEASSVRMVAPADTFGLNVVFGRALESLWMAFQPIVDLKRRSVIAYEALLRSKEPALPTPPAVVDAAERLGKVFELGQQVRSLVAARFHELPDPALTVFVNIHTSELLDPFLYTDDGALTSMAKNVVLEITERSSLDGISDVVACARDLRALGFRLALDDLGAGYAGLSAFTLLEPEVVKLDMTLIRGISESTVKLRLTQSMVDLCHDLGMLVVAEGIETRAELECVAKTGCDLGQGYFFAKPSVDFKVLLPEWGETG